MKSNFTFTIYMSNKTDTTSLQILRIPFKLDFPLENMGADGRGGTYVDLDS